VIEAADTVQAQNDFITAATGLNKARSALDLAQLQHKRAKDLFEGKAVPLKDFQQADANPDPGAERSALDGNGAGAARNKLRILGLTDDAISAFQEKGPSIRKRRSLRRSRARWSSARSARANM